jgi:Pyridoxamine 5'-phosphate oxidase.
MTAALFAPLAGHQYMNLTTFRKNGQPVPTPVWFAQEGDRIYVVTQAASGKVKRIRANPRVQLTPSDARGKPLGATIEAQRAFSILRKEKSHAARWLRNMA